MWRTDQRRGATREQSNTQSASPTHNEAGEDSRDIVQALKNIDTVHLAWSRQMWQNSYCEDHGRKPA